MPTSLKIAVLLLTLPMPLSAPNAWAAQETRVVENAAPRKNSGNNAVRADSVTINLPESITKEQADAILNELRQIRQLLEKQAAELTRIGVRQSAEVAEPERVQMSVAGDWNVIGRGDAPVTVVEFTDYECPFCRQFHTETFAQIKKQYIDTGKVRWITRDLPLEMHHHALKAAQAAHCAAEQGKYWPMYDILLSSDSPLNEEAIKKSADRLSLDQKIFQTCLDSGRHLSEVRKDVADAKTIQITSTPTFVVAKTAKDTLDGSVIVGAQSITAFQSAIDTLLAQ